MPDTNELFDKLLAAYRNADDPDRFLREFFMRLDDATSNAVVAAERKLDRLDAAKARLDAARQIPRSDTSQDRPDTSPDGDDEQDQDDDQDVEQAEASPQPKTGKVKRPAAGADAQDGDDGQEQDVEQAEASPQPKKGKVKRPAAEADALVNANASALRRPG